MAIAKVEKVQLIAHSSLKEELLSLLQEEGLIHMEPVDFSEWGLGSSSEDDSHIDHFLYKLSQAIEYLSQWEERSLAARLSGRKPSIQKREREHVLNFDYKSILDKVEKLGREKDELESQIKHLKKEGEGLAPLRALKIPLKRIRSTVSVEIGLGVVASSCLEELSSWAEKERLYVYAIRKEKRNSYILWAYPVREKAQWEQTLREMNMVPFYFTEPVLHLAEPQDRVEDVLRKLEEEVEARQKRLAKIDREGQRLFVHREELMRVYDVLLNERKKIQSSRFLGKTERVFYLEGWICALDVPRLKTRLKSYSAYVECFVRPPLPEEDPPVILENPRAGRPFEVITKLYGLPQRNSLDPTLFLAPFFFIFVGLTVSEAGYGLLVVLLSSLFLKFGKPKGNLRLFMTLLLILGGANVIVGTLFGGWFGFPIRKLMVIDPLQSPVSFLLLALALGFIQVWFGTLLSMISGIKNREYSKAIFVQGGWLLLLPGLVLYALTKQTVCYIPIFVGIAGIVFFSSSSRNPLARFFGGLYGLYSISGYLSDILSYSRLLALGLATSVIAMVVNTLSQTALGIPWVGWVFAVLIFIGGHLFNLGISFLGGFVHSMRLQFVEFFSKFFKSGGRAFKPFELESKYSEFI